RAKDDCTSLAWVVRRLIRNASLKRGSNSAKPKAVPQPKRKKMAARFAFIACIKDGSQSDAKLAEDYLYAEGDVRGTESALLIPAGFTRCRRNAIAVMSPLSRGCPISRLS